MNWYKIAQQIYRGDPNPLDMDKYDPEYGTKTLGEQLGSSLAEGPGIYFTTKKDEASGYGSNITQFNLNNANILTPKSKKFTYRQIDRILKNVDKQKMDDAISNWDENYNTGKNMLISAIVDDESVIGQLIGIWVNVFYHQNPNAFMELMVKNGIDGIAIPKLDSTHYVIYNRNILK
jgi:hypothetical protein